MTSDRIEGLPSEIWLDICRYLDAKSILSISATCKTLNQHFIQIEIWRRKCKMVGINFPNKSRIDLPSNYKKLFSAYLTERCQLKSGIYSIAASTCDDRFGLSSLVTFNHFVITGSWNGHLAVNELASETQKYNAFTCNPNWFDSYEREIVQPADSESYQKILKAPKLLKQYVNCNILCLVKDDDWIFVGLNSFPFLEKCQYKRGGLRFGPVCSGYTLTAAICMMDILNHQILACNSQNRLLLIDYRSNAIRELVIDTDLEIKHIGWLKHQSFVVMYSNGTWEVWHLQNQDIECVFKCGIPSIGLLVGCIAPIYHQRWIIVGGMVNDTVQCWTLNCINDKYNLTQSHMSPVLGKIRCLQVKSNLILVGCWNSNLMVYDLQTQELARILQSRDKSPILAISTVHNSLICGHNNGSLSKWEFENTKLHL
ncbi:hypothetical protein BC833DRAFT_576058 [Globomyces pollinis-pini]|nr:hypothetical protein BC833DRAFT_576058 [Globomyces pollinis-pini]